MGRHFSRKVPGNRLAGRDPRQHLQNFLAAERNIEGPPMSMFSNQLPEKKRPV